MKSCASLPHYKNMHHQPPSLSVFIGGFFSCAIVLCKYRAGTFTYKFKCEPCLSYTEPLKAIWHKKPIIIPNHKVSCKRMNALVVYHSISLSLIHISEPTRLG